MRRQNVVEQIIMFACERLRRKLLWAKNILYLMDCSIFEQIMPKYFSTVS